MTSRLVSASVHEKAEKSSMRSDRTRRKKTNRKPLKQQIQQQYNLKKATETNSIFAKSNMRLVERLTVKQSEKARAV